MKKYAVLTLSVIALCGYVSAQPGIWSDMFGLPSVPGAGSNLVWAGDSVYYLRGGGTNQIGIFDPRNDRWYADTLNGIYPDTGATATWAGDSFIYLLEGGGTQILWRLNKRNIHDYWLTVFPEASGAGGAVCWNGDTGIFVMPGAGSTHYYVYWSTRGWRGPVNLPGVTGAGACAAWAGGDSLYILRGGGSRDFWAVAPLNSPVSEPMVPAQIGAGASLVWNGETGNQAKLFMLPGGGSQARWSYDVATGVWDSLPNVPGPVGGAAEGALATFDRRADRYHLYTTPGSSGSKFWRYGPRNASPLPFDESFEENFFPHQSWRIDWPLVTRWTSGTHPAAVPYTGAWMGVFMLYGTTNTWTGLWTPPLLANSGPRLAKMNFRLYQSPDGDQGDTLFICRSSDGIHYSTSAAFPRWASVAGWYSKSVVVARDLPDTFYTAFYAHSGSSGSNDYNMYIDSVHIWQPSVFQDVGATAIASPLDTVPEGTLVTPQARVKNFGSVAATFRVKFKIGSAYVDSQQISGLAPGDSATLLFTSWTATRGAYSEKCSTAMTGDEDPTDDAVTSPLYVSAYDVGAVRIWNPSGSAPLDSGSTTSPQLLVKNFGNMATPVRAVFNIGSFYTDTNTLANLNPGDSNVLWFTPWQALQRGTHLMTCRTLLANDGNHANDTCSGLVSVRVRDVGPTRIVAPPDTVDSGSTVTPMAMVRNFGTTTESFSVQLRIGGFYSNNQAVSNLPAGESVSVTFANWQAVQGGTHAVRCSTLLVGDMYLANDLVVDSVTVGYLTGLNAEGPSPVPFFLDASAPNPITASGLMRFGVAKACAVNLSIYGSDGRLVRELASGVKPAGRYHLTWDRLDNRGKSVRAGIYYCRYVTGAFVATRKLVVAE